MKIQLDTEWLRNAYKICSVVLFDAIFELHSLAPDTQWLVDCVGSLDSFFERCFSSSLIWVRIYWLIFQTECRLQTHTHTNRWEPAAEATTIVHWMVFVVIIGQAHYCFLLTVPKHKLVLLRCSNMSCTFFFFNFLFLFASFRNLSSLLARQHHISKNWTTCHERWWIL